ncbi:DUF4328 domain-containing protein [Nocardia australiensis]|uniref:DUF4328 domain-containing protein n=1 Tax=Nocardia australiensis TaxID=2887191 RepID=UPI001D1408B8|nr:DUF4328 domain-containing protein [Nocardia australiensis]
MSTVVQPCARCGARWAVQATPMLWCPRCRGVLLSPAPIDAPAKQRNYRWVARRPDQRYRRSAPSERNGPPVETPRYTEIPRWGLLDPPAAPAAAAPRPLAAFTDRVGVLLLATAIAFAVACLAELGRYGILLRNRTRLIDPLLLTVSDYLLYLSALLGLGLGLASAVAMLGWLIDARRDAYARSGRADARSVRSLALGCLVPVVNLVWPGTYLTELVSAPDRPADPRVLRAIRIWWAAWVFGGIVAVAALLWRFPDSLQAKADGVLFTAFTDVVAVAVTVLTLWLLRMIEGRDLFGHARTAHRWVIAVDPHAPIIEPVHPGGSASSEVRPDSVNSTGRDVAVAGIAEDQPVGEDASDREHEEVMAK